MQSHRNSDCSTHAQSPASGSGWAPPRSPLPPYRLAKLANALGVSAPLPAMTVSASSPSSQSHLGNLPSPSNSDLPWRSVTPSTATALNLLSPAQSKYFLHVIPPLHLPHDADTLDSTELAPPPSSASGYHTQFRRGTLVALQSTLQAQLVVIAREYALPSTIGIVLYLVTTSPQSRQDSPLLPSPSLCGVGGVEPGPRLSEEIWKHIWMRVLRAEREDLVALPQSMTPNPSGLGLATEPNGPLQSLRPLLTPSRIEHAHPLTYPITPSTSASTASSVSDTRSHDKSAGASSPLSEPDTPDTSPSSDHGSPDMIELPGLNSPSIIPILAKVEFDIDRRKATWYEPWVRSRRIKRTESRSTHRSHSRSRTLDSSSSTDDKRAPYDLKLVQRMQKPPFLRSRDSSDEGERLNNREYAPLSESLDVDATARMTSTFGHDPLGDVFGTDAETWTEIHAESDRVRRKVNNPNVIDLALDATSLTTLSERKEEEVGEADDVDEVRDIMRRMSRPPLNISIPDSAEPKRRSSPSTAVGKRPMLPPLVLAPKSPSNDLIEGETDDFRNKEGLSLELEQEYHRSRNHGEEKRVGTVFEDLDLGLDLGDDDEEYDENDPNDRRRSQYLMKAKLDAIEKTLAQFSPQQLKTAILDENSTITYHPNFSITSNSRTPPPTDSLHKVWPSVPYASVAKAVNDSPTRPAIHPPSPPRLALNGVSTDAPKAFTSASTSPSLSVLTESQIRRRELEQAMYTTIPSPSRQANATSDSPIPLSPDPFGRHPSIYEVDAAPMQSYWDPVAQNFSQDPPCSRPSVSSIDDASGLLNLGTSSGCFSADLSGVADGDKAAKLTAPLVSVKGLKKLWRKSKSSSNAVPQPPTPGRTSIQHPSSPYPHPHPPTPTDQLMTPPVPITRGPNGRTHVGQLQLDQEVSYPPYSSRPSLSGSRPNSPAILLNTHTQEKPATRKSILKSWKSVAGGGSQQQASNGSEPRKSSERPISNETIKPRRPSVLDGSIPPSPRLPEQYLPSNHKSNHIRTGSNFIGHWKSASRSKTGPGHHHASASHDLLSTIPAARSPVFIPTSGSASSSQSHLSALSRDSQTESLETSQFEVVASSKVQPNLTYPIMTLDHE